MTIFGAGAGWGSHFSQGRGGAGQGVLSWFLLAVESEELWLNDKRDEEKSFGFLVDGLGSLGALGRNGGTMINTLSTRNDFFYYCFCFDY